MECEWCGVVQVQVGYQFDSDFTKTKEPEGNIEAHLILRPVVSTSRGDRRSLIRAWLLVNPSR